MCYINKVTFKFDLKGRIGVRWVEKAGKNIPHKIFFERKEIFKKSEF